LRIANMSNSHGPLACLGVGLAEDFSLIKSQHPYKRSKRDTSSTLCNDLLHVQLGLSR
jgi:hypothetical protein